MLVSCSVLITLPRLFFFVVCDAIGEVGMGGKNGTRVLVKIKGVEQCRPHPFLAINEVESLLFPSIPMSHLIFKITQSKKEPNEIDLKMYVV